MDLCNVLREAVELKKISSTRVPDIHLDYRVNATIHGFPGEMRQLFLNLLENAIEAGATKINIRLSKIPGCRSYTKSAHRLRVTVADNGSGIDQQERSRVFEPFFTTKGEKGTGLGLWVCQGIVQKHEGLIRVRSRTKGGSSGTCLSVLLPAVTLKPVPSAASQVSGGTGI